MRDGQSLAYLVLKVAASSNAKSLIIIENRYYGNGEKLLLQTCESINDEIE